MQPNAILINRKVQGCHACHKPTAVCFSVRWQNRIYNVTYKVHSPMVEAYSRGGALGIGHWHKAESLMLNSKRKTPMLTIYTNASSMLKHTNYLLYKRHTIKLVLKFSNIEIRNQCQTRLHFHLQRIEFIHSISDHTRPLPQFAMIVQSFQQCFLFESLIKYRAIVSRVPA